MAARSNSENGQDNPQDEAISIREAGEGLQALALAADSARAQYENEKAVDLYSLALALIIEPDNFNPVLEYDLRSGREKCNRHLGKFEDCMTDVQAMLTLAESLDDITLRVKGLNRQAEIHNINGDLEAQKSTAENSLELARQAGNQQLEVDSLLWLGVAVYQLGDISRGLGYCHQARDMARELGYSSGLAQALEAIGNHLSLRQGQPAQAQVNYLESLALYRQLGDRFGEANALRGLGNAGTDLAQRRVYYEQALEIFESLGERLGQVRMFNNIAFMYLRLGLFSQAVRYASRAVEMARKLRAHNYLIVNITTLAESYIGMGNFELARSAINEARYLAQQVGRHQFIIGYPELLKGMIAMGENAPKQAQVYFLEAYEAYVDQNTYGEQAASLAWLGGAELAMGDVQAALEHTAQAVAIQEIPDSNPPQVVWWWRYQALTASDEANAPFSQDGNVGRTESPLSPDGNRGGAGAPLSLDGIGAGGEGDLAWQALNRAYELTMDGIASLSDAGLRRNYLNKVAINPQIIEAWTQAASLRGIQLPDKRNLDNLQEQFKRLLVIGARMNEARDVAGLYSFIMDQLVELSGAEQALLVGEGASGGREALASYGLPEESNIQALDEISSVLDVVARRQQPLLLPDDNDSQTILAEIGSELSVMVAPLVAGGKLRGMVYAQVRDIFGQFNEADLDLLAAFANQAAAAIENTRLYQDLEQRVEQRTADLRQRNNELAVINAVQQGLAAELDMQAIYDLVGDKIREIFDAQVVVVSSIDYQNDTHHLKYIYEKGERYYSKPVPLREFNESVFSKLGPILLNTAQSIKDNGIEAVEGTGEPKSYLDVPLVSGDVVRGGISLQNLDREFAFDETDVRLLTTLANGMSVALENARLFEETNRLLEETKQRNAELAVISTVQQGLAAELDMQAIYDLVGDKIREIFDAQVVIVTSIDYQTNTNHLKYMIEKGERYYPEPGPLREYHRSMLEKPGPILLNTAQSITDYGLETVEGTGESKSILIVPLMSGDMVRGGISLQNLDREFAFDETDVRLLTTLANGMSVALENARHFAETNRLLEETKQRNAELAVISTVQQGLASQLNQEAILELVGDQVREIFDAQVVTINRFDTDNDRSEYLYVIEKGERLEVAPQPLNKANKRMIKDQQPVLVNSGVPEYLQSIGHKVPAGEMPRSFIIVPMIVSGEVTGCITLQNVDRENVFHQSDVRLLSTLANSMSVALENARLFDQTKRLLDETQQRNSELAVINTVQQGLGAELDMQAIYDLVGDQIQEIFNAQATIITSLDFDEGQEHIRYMVEKGVRYYPRPKTFSILIRKLIETRQPILLQTLEAIETMGLSIIDETEMSKSIITVPLIVSGAIKGAISLQNIDREYAFDDSDVRLLSTLANGMSVALENARLFEETKRRANEMAALTDIGREISATLDLPTVLDRIAAHAQGPLSAATSAVILLEDDRQTLKPIAVVGKNAQAIKAFEWQLGQGLIGSIAESGQAERIEDASRDPRAIHITGTDEEEESERMMVAPLHSRTDVIGAMVVWRDGSEDAFSEQDLNFLLGMSRQATIAIQNARLYDEAQLRAREMAALTEIGREISATLDLPTVLEQIATRARSELQARDVVLRLLEPDGSLPTVVAVGKYADVFKTNILHVGQGLTGNVAQTGVPEVVNYPMQDPRMVHVPGTASDDEEDEAILFAPLLFRDQVTGVMVLWRQRSVNGPFSENDLEFSVGLARQAAIAIENARLFEETDRRARETAATNQVLQIISSSPGNVQPVLDAVAQKAAELCQAEDALILLVDDGAIKPVASYGNLPKIESGDGGGELLRVPLTRQHVGGRAIIDCEVVSIDDILAEPDEEFGAAKELNASMGIRTMLAAPLLREGQAAGAILIRRQQVRPFNRKQIELLQTFANQAVIAIENARLFNEIQTQKQYSEALVTTSPVAIVTTDLEGEVVSWNPGAEKLFGYTPKEAIGQNLDQLVAATEALQAEAASFSEDARKGRLNLLTQRTRKDGSLVDVELSAVPVVVDGRQVGLIAIYHDISELQGARQEAEAANEAKSAFLATMSHEIRTPMNAVIGMSGLLLDTQLNPEQREYAEIIRKSSDDLLMIINDILDFSKIEAGRMELEQQPFDLRECVEGTLDLVAGRAFERRLDIAYLIEANTPETLLGDVTRLRQILLNLFTNAVKFTDEGEVVLSISSQPVARPGEPAWHELLFSVRDTGIGIPAERMNRLFQSFSQVDTSTARKYGGTGLGLAISKRLSEMMGGRMWVESELGVGTTFYFTILAQSVDQPLVARPHLKDHQPLLEDKRVLIVDDNDTNRRVLNLQVDKWGMQSGEVASAAEALEKLAGGDVYDVAILDMHMPGMDGMTLAREIRKLPEGKNLPLVLFTSLGRREVDVEEVDFAAHLTKPIKPSLLFDALIGIFAKQKVTPSKTIQSPARFDAEMAQRHPLRILLAEDNAVNQKLALRLLGKIGYRADVAGNGLEAIEALERQSYDVILMDVQMPEMDGLEATRQIVQRWSQRYRPCIVAMTANAMQGDREMCLKAGMDDYIAKPIRVEDLVSALSQVKPATQEAGI